VSYENPEVPHEVNVARENAVLEFVQLVIAIAAVVVALAAGLYLSGGWLARLIPFATERAWVGDRVLGIAVEPAGSTDHVRLERYLQRLADGLAAHMALPEPMTVTVHYADLDVANAFATLGGHIVVTSELYKRMPSENSLAMVLAHEIAHVKRRDPISAIGGGATLALAAALVSGQTDSLAPQLATLVQLGYSRDAEARADAAAVAALIAVYGHAGGGAAAFEVLAQQSSAMNEATPTFLSTHPADAERIERLRRAAHDWNAARQPLAALEVAVPEPNAAD